MLIRAVVFNLCGTLVNLRPFRFQTMADVLVEEGIAGSMDPASLAERFAGADDLTIANCLTAEKRVGPEKVVPLCWQFEKAFGEKLTVALDRGELRAYRGSKELLKELAGSNIPVAVVSETSAAVARMVLRRVTGLETDAIVGIDSLNAPIWDFYMNKSLEEIDPAIADGPGGKDIGHHLLWTVDPDREYQPAQGAHIPFPDRRFYEAALSYLDIPVKPEEVIAFEDSAESGAVTNTTGYQTILVAHTNRREDLRKVTNPVLDGMPESLDTLKRLFGMEFKS